MSRYAVIAAADRSVAVLSLAASLAFAASTSGAQAPAQAGGEAAGNTLSLASAPTPDSLAALALRGFESGTPDAFDSVVVDAAARAVVRDAAQRNRGRRGGVARIVSRSPGRAVILLSGTLALPNGGDAMNGARRFAGFYEAAEQNGAWKLGRQLPLDGENRILAHALDLELAPGKRIEVVDTMDIEVRHAHGFAVRLNPATRLASITIDGTPAEHAIGGGILWLAPPARPRARVVLRYSLELARDANSAESDSIGPMYGILGNDYGWLPFFDYNAWGDHAIIALTVRLPAAYHVATSLPQTETVSGPVRTVRARSEEGTFVVAVLYDREWRRSSGVVGPIRYDFFLTPGFMHSPDTLVSELRRAYQAISRRFGDPVTKYIGVAEQRSLTGGFRYRANNVVISGKGGGRIKSAGPVPSSVYAHEVAHGWTTPKGPGANWLREGWATFVESIVLRDELGPEVEQAFWEVRRNQYVAGSEGRLSILGNPDNGTVHYARGSWVLRMLCDLVGDSTFDRGVREFMALAAREPAGHEEFIAIMSRVAKRDVRSFLMPWLTERVAPDLDARVDGVRVIVTQSGPLFDLQVPLQLTTASGAVRRTLRVSRRADTLDIGDVGPVTAVRIDPDRRLLLNRHFGESTVRFELRADSAKQVALIGDFTRAPIPAARQGDRWVLEIPMTEGRYYWIWQIDGQAREAGYDGVPTSGVRVVNPVERVTGAYPRS